MNDNRTKNKKSSNCRTLIFPLHRKHIFLTFFTTVTDFAVFFCHYYCWMALFTIGYCKLYRDVYHSVLLPLQLSIDLNHRRKATGRPVHRLAVLSIFLVFHNFSKALLLTLFVYSFIFYSSKSSFLLCKF